MAETSGDLRERILKIRLLIMDCDGVLTDGRIIPLPGGDETKLFDAKDGHSIRMASRAGLKTAIISGRTSFAVQSRARDLGIDHLYEQAWVKLEPYEAILAKEGLRDQEVCFVGDDVTDIPLLRRVGLAVAVSDAVEEAKQYAHLITEHAGGRGAVRELVRLLLKTQGKWEAAMARYEG
jgi:3-deoxy-D-manno-octulosonate 8-phosphate phosphatase (KDO 8-P phosphatase)